MVLPGSRMYIADATRLVPSAWRCITIDSIALGSSSRPSRRYSEWTKCSKPPAPRPSPMDRYPAATMAASSGKRANAVREATSSAWARRRWADDRRGSSTVTIGVVAAALTAVGVPAPAPVPPLPAVVWSWAPVAPGPVLVWSCAAAPAACA